MVLLLSRLLPWSLAIATAPVHGLSKPHLSRTPQCQQSLACRSHENESPRRRVLGLLSSCAASCFLWPSSSGAVTRAVGGAEELCRKTGNCLEVGEWDGAVGWTWGAKERCDPNDPRCGADGTLRGALAGKPIPKPAAAITHQALIQIDIGGKGAGLLNLGLYGDDCPGSTEELVQFFSTGLSTIIDNEVNFGSVTSPVSLATGGVVSYITPRSTVDFGVASQSRAYGRARGLSRVDGFMPQKRPEVKLTANDRYVRSHDTAGLLSVSSKGLGYGGTGFERDDECFERAFLITADNATFLDRDRRVVGQVIDADSMSFLERLANLPTKRGIRGVIPGQTMGAPLLRVTVRDVDVSNVRLSDPKMPSL